MAGLPWIISFLCAAGCHLSAPSPVLHTSLVVQVQTGGNVSLPCNVTSRTVLNWYHLRSDQLLHLLTIVQSKFKKVDPISDTKNARLSWSRDLKSGKINLEITEVGEGDAGRYFCAESGEGHVHVNSGIQLIVDGVDGEFTEDRLGQPCWSVGICVLPSLLSICFLVLFGLYFCSGKAAVCCCNTVRWDAGLRATQEEPVLYSSVKHQGKPRPGGRGETRRGEEPVIYSKVMNRSHDHR